jgi:hypothetical protein
MFGQFKNQRRLIQWLKLVGSLVPCLTINHTNYNTKVYCNNQHAMKGF